MRPRPFRFSLQAYHATSAADWVRTARRAEEIGYSTLFTTDHYFGPGAISDGSGHRPVDVAPVSAMTMAAAVTSTLRVGCRVFGVDYHHPVVLAKELATVDFLTGGRLEAAIGAGWVKAEYDGLGLTMDKPSVRIERLRETIALLRAHWGGEQLDMHGGHVSVSGFAGTPAPVQQRIPLMVGGGARKVLTLAGETADIVSLNFNNAAGALGAGSVASGTEQQTADKIGWIRDGAGERFGEIELEIGAYFVAVTDDAERAATAIGTRFGVDAQAILSHPHALMGTVQEICAGLEQRRRDFGVSYVCVAQRHMDEFAPVVQAMSGH